LDLKDRADLSAKAAFSAGGIISRVN